MHVSVHWLPNLVERDEAPKHCSSRFQTTVDHLNSPAPMDVCNRQVASCMCWTGGCNRQVAIIDRWLY